MPLQLSRRARQDSNLQPADSKSAVSVPGPDHNIWCLPSSNLLQVVGMGFAFLANQLFFFVCLDCCHQVLSTAYYSSLGCCQIAGTARPT